MGITVIIPAAGQGRRMKQKVNKQYLLLGDKPILAHTCGIFQSLAEIDSIYIIVPPGDEDYCKKEIVEKFSFSKVRMVLPGGRERQESVLQGIRNLPPKTEIVLIHDGARPLVTRGVILEVLAAAKEYGAATAGVPVKDTIKVVDAQGFGVDTPPRDQLWAVQTPQAFKAPLLIKAHQLALELGYTATDDTALIEMAGGKVKIVEGSYENIKITTPEDIILAEKILQGRELHADRDRV